MTAMGTALHEQCKSTLLLDMIFLRSKHRTHLVQIAVHFAAELRRAVFTREEANLALAGGVLHSPPQWAGLAPGALPQGAGGPLCT